MPTNKNLNDARTSPVVPIADESTSEPKVSTSLIPAKREVGNDDESVERISLESLSDRLTDTPLQTSTLPMSMQKVKPNLKFPNRFPYFVSIELKTYVHEPKTDT